MKYNYTLDIGALILYSVIISLYIQRPHVKDKMHNIYIMLFTCAYISPIFDIISSITVNNNMHSALVITSTALYFLSLQGVTFCFTIYIVYQIEQFKKVSHVNRHLLAAPNFFMVMLIITNDLSQLIFKYSRNGGYSRGSLHFLCYIVPLMYFAWAVLYLFSHRKAYDRNFVITIENICIVNIIFIIIQFFFPYLLLISFGFAVSMVLLYLTARTKNASLDKDSGMLNREYFIDAGTKMIYSKVPFSLVLVKIQDYDSTSNLYGEELASILMKKIASKLCSYVEIGEAFQLNIDSFAFIIKNKEEVSIIESEFRLKLSSEWTVLERKLSIPFLITNISFPEKIHSLEEFISLASYFEKLVTAKTGIISCDELKYKDSVRE